MNQDLSYFGNERKEMISFLPKDGFLYLDIGCGTGSFGKVLKNQFRQAVVYGVEPNEEAFKKAKENLDFAINDTVENALDYFNSLKFDAIILNDVLEHLQNRENVLKKLQNLLSDNGKIIISLPNLRYYKVLYHLIFQKDFYYQDSGILDRTHLAFFTKKSAIRMFNELGYEVQQVKGINDFTSFLFRLVNIFTLFIFNDTRYLQYAFVLSKAP